MKDSPKTEDGLHILATEMGLTLFISDDGQIVETKPQPEAEAKDTSVQAHKSFSQLT